MNMLSIGGNRRYFVYGQNTDLRKSFDGLSGLVSSHMGGGMLSGDAFIFINKRRNRMKILQWDRNGFVIYYKRLERGTFEIPLGKARSDKIEIPWSHLVMILEGIQLRTVRQRLRYTG